MEAVPSLPEELFGAIAGAPGMIGPDLVRRGGVMLSAATGSQLEHARRGRV
jgi:hypothetical protein